MKPNDPVESDTKGNEFLLKEEELAKEVDRSSVRHFFEKTRQKPPKLITEKDKSLSADECAINHIRLCEAFGTVNGELINQMVNQAVMTLPPWQQDKDSYRNAVVAALHGIRPRNELEGMMAIQMVSVHNMALEYMRRSMIENQPSEYVEVCLSRAHRLLRTFTLQLEALNKGRRKGKQQVTVKHVHVHKGGQAIVGMVNDSQVKQKNSEGGGESDAG